MSAITLRWLFFWKKRHQMSANGLMLFKKGSENKNSRHFISAIEAKI
jgi:hypothetical protein